MTDNDNIMKEEYEKNGYIICKNVFTEQELDNCKAEILAYIKTNRNKVLKNGGGITIPDFINQHSSLVQTIQLKENKKIHETLQILFGGTNYRFCSHNDIGINRIVGWHKDKLNGKYANFEKHDIWQPISIKNEDNTQDEVKHQIVKVLIYLEDHTHDNDGLKLVPGSHVKREIYEQGAIQLHSQKGDVVIFNQRINHRGMAKQCPDNRILVSFGFGRNNVFTDEFEKGTIQRQKDQNI